MSLPGIHLRTISQWVPKLLTLKRPGLCGSLQLTQFKPRFDWMGSAAQVRRYCVDSVAQAFIHALVGCIPRSLQNALCGPRNSWPAHFAAHALDVLATHNSPSLTQLSTVGTSYSTNVGVQKIPDRAIWKPVVAKRNNTNPWSCPEPQILVTRDPRQLHMG